MSEVDPERTPTEARGLWLRRAALFVWVALVLGGTSPYFEGLLDANERPRLLAGIALVSEGSVRVDGPWAEGIPVGPDVALGADGELVPNKPPGATVVASGAWALLRGLAPLRGGTVSLRDYTISARWLGGLLPTLILALVLWRSQRQWAEHRAAAAHESLARARARVDLALLVWLLATPAWANAKLLFGHSLAACLLGVGAVLLAGRPGRELSPGVAAVAGASMGAAVLVEYTAAFAGPVIGVWLVWRERGRWGVIVAALAGALVPILALAGYHDAVFGSPWTTGYHRVVRDDFAAIHGRGLLGLQLPSATSLYEHLISPWGGLLVWAPLCPLALFAGLHRQRSDTDAHARARLLLFTAIAGALVLVLVGLEQGGGWRVGPRYYVLAMPLCVPGVVALLRECEGPQRGMVWVLVSGLSLAAFAANFVAANWFPHLIPHGNPLGDLLAPLIASGRVPHGLSPWWVLGLALGLWALVLPGFVRGLGAPRWAHVAGLGLGLALFAAQFVAPASDPFAELELEMVEQLWEPDAAGDSPASRVLEAGERAAPSSAR